MTDIHDAFTSLSAHGLELPVELTQDVREAVDRLVGCWWWWGVLCQVCCIRVSVCLLFGSGRAYGAALGVCTNCLQY